MKQSSFFYFSGLLRFARNDGKTPSLITTTNHKAKGFTLVELAIVIVIIGVLLVGVMQGQALIESARVNRAVTDFNKYNAAMEIFRSKYNAVPGDMRNAYAFLDGSGGNSICGANNDPSWLFSGCNGSGNGQLAESYSHDSMRVWIHLKAAKLINENIYIDNSSTTDRLVVTPKDQANVPFSDIADGAAFSIISPNMEPSLFTPLAFNGKPGAWLALSKGVNGPYLAHRLGNTMTPSVAQSIDMKMDDGFPTMGNVAGVTLWYNTVGTCASGGGVSNLQVINLDIITLSTATTYAVNETVPSCAIMFKLPY